MPERLTKDEWFELIRIEADPFKLTIRAFAAIEAEIDAYTERLFRTPMPGGMKSLGPISRRIPVASALGVIPDTVLPLLGAMQRLRNDFAHGDVIDVDEQRAAILQQHLRAFIEAENIDFNVEGDPPVTTLRSSLLMIRFAIDVAGEVVFREQQEANRTLAVKRAIDQRLGELRGPRPDNGA